jgi:hypothetical protein
MNDALWNVDVVPAGITRIDWALIVISHNAAIESAVAAARIHSATALGINKLRRQLNEAELRIRDLERELDRARAETEFAR